MICPNCGYSNKVPGKFCGQCGMVLTFNTAGGTPVAHVLSAGAVLQNGRYRIEKKLGQGGMGAVYLARDSRLGDKLVVVKEMVVDSSDPTEQAEAARNFNREAVLLSNIGKHPLIPAVYDNFTEGARNFLVMEYIDGENLEDRLTRQRHPISEQEALHYASQMCDALDFLSQETPPVIHRDIKPANIIISKKTNRANLVDFGIARETLKGQGQAGPKQSQALGTPGYCPPEQYQNRADPRSDLYALAATIHHVVTGRDPRNEAPFVYPPVRSLVPGLSPELERILAKELVMDPNQRYQSAAEMKTEIDELLTPQTVIRPSVVVAPKTGSSLPTRIAGRPNFLPQQSNMINPGTPPYTPPPYLPQQSYPRPLPFQPPKQRGGGNTAIIGGGIAAVVIALLVIGLIFFLIRPRTTAVVNTATPTQGTALAITPTPNAPPKGDTAVALSMGEMAFDTVAPRKDVDMKTKAAAAIAAKDYTNAQALLQQATTLDPSDAEAWIYLENLRIQQTGAKYVTVVVGTMVTGADNPTGRSDLQGAYVNQYEVNRHSLLPGGLQMRVMIANSGDKASGAGVLATQIASKVNSGNPDHIIAVMGWPFSSRALNAYPAITGASIPLVSQTASNVRLSGVSKYFFRVCPPDSEQGNELALYASRTLKGKRIVVVSDPADSYSHGLAAVFTEQVQQLNAQVIAQENFKQGETSDFFAIAQNAVDKKADLVFFAGLSREAIYLADAVAKASPTLQVLGGDGVYDPAIVGNGSSDEARFARENLSEMSRLHFTSFAYPDEWAFLNQGTHQPAFFSDYKATFFDPSSETSYGSSRADYNSMLSFDAMQAIALGIKATGKDAPTPAEVGDKLATLPPFQGVSGQVLFTGSGDPKEKAIVILHVSDKGNVQIERVIGKFFV